MQHVVAMSAGLNTRIVNKLREYGEVRIDFLAQLLGRRAAEIFESVEYLKREGIVDLKDDKISLASARPPSRPQAFPFGR